MRRLASLLQRQLGSSSSLVWAPVTSVRAQPRCWAPALFHTMATLQKARTGPGCCPLPATIGGGAVHCGQRLVRPRSYNKAAAAAAAA